MLINNLGIKSTAYLRVMLDQIGRNKMSIDLRKIQQEIVPKGVRTLSMHGMCWYTGQERAGKTYPTLATMQAAGYTVAICITTLKALPDIREAHQKLKCTFQLFAINYESVHKLTPEAIKLAQIVWLDESHKLGQAPKRAKTVDKIKKICINKRIIYTTATPSAEGYHKLYHQFWVSSYNPLAKWKNFYEFAKEFINITFDTVHGREIPKYTDVNFEKLWPHIGHLFITWTRKDAGFKVEPEDHILEVTMSKKCIEIYRSLNKDKIYIDDRGNASIANSGGDLKSKLAQISSGTLFFDERIDKTIDEDGAIIDTSKAEFIKQFFFGRKIAIFYKFTAEGRLLRTVFPNHTDDYKLFNERSDLVYIDQCQRSAEGVPLWSAYALVHYNIDWKATIYFQLRARHCYLERTEPAYNFYIFSKHGIDRDIYEAVSKKQDFTWSWYRDNKLTKKLLAESAQEVAPATEEEMKMVMLVGGVFDKLKQR